MFSRNIPIQKANIRQKNGIDIKCVKFKELTMIKNIK